MLKHPAKDGSDEYIPSCRERVDSDRERLQFIQFAEGGESDAFRGVDHHYDEFR